MNEKNTIEKRMLAYAQHDEYNVTRNLLLEGAYEIMELKEQIWQLSSNTNHVPNVDQKTT